MSVERAFANALSAAWATMLLAGCPAEPPGVPSGGDAAAPADGAVVGPDAGAALPWPEATLEIQDARNPAFAQAPDGRLMLAYQQGGQVFVQNDPPAGTPAALGAGSTSGSSELRMVASPTEDRAFVVWTDGSGVSLTGGVPDGPASPLYDGLGSLYSLAPGWVGDRPYVLARVGEVWYGPDHYPPMQLGFHVPLGTPGALPMPSTPVDGAALRALPPAFHHYTEAEQLLDLGQGRALTFLNSWETNEADAQDPTHYARWWVLGQAPSGRWLRIVRSGQLAMPETGVAWIQAHALGEGRYALTWAGSANTSLVYEVFVAGLAIDADGTPSLTTAPVNVSMTLGDTDNSDHPVLASAGDGRTWLAWREFRYGPRVALLGSDFRVTALSAPPVDLECNGSSSIAGVADADGTFHLAAAVVPGGALSLRYWRFPRP